MREIKFRLLHDSKIVGWEKFYLGARNKETGEWTAIPQWLYSSDGEYWNPDGGRPFVTEREQFTGLKDKNGKEIFEGDVLSLNRKGQYGIVQVRFGKYDDSSIEWGSPGIGWYAVGYHGYIRVDGRRDTYWIGAQGEPEMSLMECSDWIVVGNIHENPELLKGESQ